MTKQSSADNKIEPGGQKLKMMALKVFFALAIVFILFRLVPPLVQEKADERNLQGQFERIKADLDATVKATIAKINKLKDSDSYGLGKTIIVNIVKNNDETTYEYSNINLELLKFKQLPIANSYKELETITALEYVSVPVGRYSDDTKACRIDCNLRVVDIKHNSIIARKIIRGPEPPPKKPKTYTTVSWDGGPPSTISLIDYLRSLPSKRNK